MTAAGLTSIGYISDLEAGRVMPTLPSLEKLAGALDVLLLDLFVAPTPATLRERVVDLSRAVPDTVLRRWGREGAEHRAKRAARTTRSS